jgi:hypothetical protein
VWLGFFGAIKVGQFRNCAPTYFRYFCIFPEYLVLSKFSPYFGTWHIMSYLWVFALVMHGFNFFKKKEEEEKINVIL